MYGECVMSCDWLYDNDCDVYGMYECMDTWMSGASVCVCVCVCVCVWVKQQQLNTIKTWSKYDLTYTPFPQIKCPHFISGIKMKNVTQFSALPLSTLPI